MHISDTTKLYCLLLLHQSPKYGYELIKGIGAHLGKPPSAGQIYPFLENLKKNQIIKIIKKGIKKKKVYSLTKQGKSFVNQKLKQFDELIQLAIEPKLDVCAHCACKVFETAHFEKVGGKTQAFCCPSCAKAYKPYCCDYIY